MVLGCSKLGSLFKVGYFYGTILVNNKTTQNFISALHSPALFFGLDEPIGKYGPKFNSDCMVFSAPPLKKYLNKCFGSSYWATIKTVFRHLSDWELVSGKKVYYPFSHAMVAMFILYLIENVQIAPSTMYQYVSALKALHKYQGHSLHGLEDQRTKLLLRGYNNIMKTINPRKQTRKVLHWETLQLFGAEFVKVPGHTYEDKQAIWTALLLSFWASARFGDFMPGSQGMVPEKVLTWERIQMPESYHAAIYFHIPKQDREGFGVVKDVIKFKDPVYCPIYNLQHLCDIRLARREVVASEPVFLRHNDKMVNMALIRRTFSCLDKYYPEGANKLNCHSVRAALPTWMASQPEFYTEKEIKDAGNWKKDTYRRYCKNAGIARVRTLRKISSQLARYLCYSI